MRRHRILRSGAAARLAAGALVAGLASFAAPAAHAQAAGCVLAFDAATAFASSLPGEAASVALCIEACKVWERGCQEIVEASTKCVLESRDTEVDIEIVTDCKALTGSARRACQSDETLRARNLRKGALSGRVAGLGVCRNRAASCRSACDAPT